MERTGDPGLDSVMDEIDVRAAVELAKLEMADRRRNGR
ncbi:MAG: flagellar assembly protein FliX [Alphaproteobacteria bacterium]